MLRRFFLFIGMSAVLAATAIGADISGNWVARTKTPGGGVRETGFVFHQDGEKLTGAVLGPQGEVPISDGKILGDTVSFAVVLKFGDQERRTLYTGKLADGELQLTMRSPGMGPGGAPREVSLTAQRGQPLMATLPRIPPPALHDVPANGLVRTPPMGWNSWNHFQAKIDDRTVREIADAMAANGMKAAGYIYVNIDDTWEGTRDAQGNIQTNGRFPDMKALADYVHSKGLKLGIYSSPGPRTCAGFEGSYGHEAQDARTYAQWGIDYLKYDWCSAGQIYTNSDLQAVYQKMGDALEATGRPIIYSLCEYGLGNVWQWAPKVSGNLWRTTGDIRDSWQSMSSIGFRQGDLAPYAGPGHWNDPDMLEIGNGGMSDTEYRSHFTLWAMLAAPLLAGNDLRQASPATLEILTNAEVIGVDQDALGRQGTRVSQSGDTEVWKKPLSNGRLAVGLFNRGDSTAEIIVRWEDLGLAGKVRVRDLWSHADLGSRGDSFSAKVPPHGVTLIRVEP